ncbi:hypothetical protein Slala03_57760 [Streptomyces lavendulae subsp. lavendulae]|nr:hypothetical protein Slala03_57760 [Streptomyces lavendulae subsp. lavendulae]
MFEAHPAASTTRSPCAGRSGPVRDAARALRRRCAGAARPDRCDPSLGRHRASQGVPGPWGAALRAVRAGAGKPGAGPGNAVGPGPAVADGVRWGGSGPGVRPVGERWVRPRR